MKNPYLLVDHKLVEDYQMSTPAMVPDAVAVATFEGRPAFFSVAQAGEAYFTYYDPSSKSMWRQEALGIKADHIAAAHHPAYGTVLVASRNLPHPQGEVHCKVEFLTRKSRADKWESEGHEFMRKVKGLRLKNVGNRLCLMLFADPNPRRASAPVIMHFTEWIKGERKELNTTQLTMNGPTADFGIGPKGEMGVYALISPCIYLRDAGAHELKRVCTDKDNDAATGGRRLSVWELDRSIMNIDDVSLGHHAEKNHADTAASTMKLALAVEDPNSPLLKPVTQAVVQYNTQNTKSMPFSLLTPVAEQGYVSLGDLGNSQHYDKGRKLDVGGKISAVRADFTTLGTSSPPLIWETNNAKSNKNDKKTQYYVSVIGVAAMSGSKDIATGTFKLSTSAGASPQVHCIVANQPVGKVLLFCGLDGKKPWQTLPVDWDRDITKIAVAEHPEKAQPSAVVGVSADGGFHHLGAADGHGRRRWQAVAKHPKQKFTDIAAIYNGRGDLDVWLRTASWLLAHATLPAGPTASWNSPFFLTGKKDLVSIGGILRDGGGNVHAIVEREENEFSRSVKHLFSDPKTSNWDMHDVHVDFEPQLQEIRSYSVQLTAMDASDVPLFGTSLEVWTEGPALVKVNGKSYMTDTHPAARAKVMAQPDGKCRIMVPATSLDAPILHIHADFMQPGEYVSLAPNADMQLTLAQMTDAKSLKNARKNVLHSDPTPVFNGFADSDLDGIGQMLGKTMQMVPKFDAAADLKYLRYNLSPEQIKVKSKQAALAKGQPLGALRMPARGGHFEFSIIGGKVGYCDLTSRQANAKMAKLAATESDNPKKVTVSGMWGDFWNSIKLAGAKAKEYLVLVTHVVADGLEAVITYTLNGIEYVYRGVARLVQEVFAMVEGVFAAIGLAFEDLVQWLGYVFDWEDILRTHRAIRGLVHRGIALQKEAVLQMKVGVDDFLKNLSDKAVKDIQDKAKAILGDTSQNKALKATVGKTRKENDESPEARTVMSHNVAYNGMMDNADRSQPSPKPQAPPEANQLFDTLAKLLDEPQLAGIADRLATKVAAIQQAEDKFLALTLDLIVELVQDLVAMAISLMRGVAAVFFNLIVDALEGLLGICDHAWEIPFVTPLYAKVTQGEKLTLLDLACLMVAIPATPLYKIATGNTPFPTEGALDQFLKGIGISENHRQVPMHKGAKAKGVSKQLTSDTQPKDGPLHNFAVQGLPIIQAVARFFKTCFDTVLALLPPTIDPQKIPLNPKPKWEAYKEYYGSIGVPTHVAAISGVFGLVDQVSQIPLNLFGSGSILAKLDFKTVRGMSNWYWIGMTGYTAYELFDVVKNGKKMESDGITGIVWTMLKGIGKFAGAVVVESFRKPGNHQALVTGSSCAAAIPEICSLLRYDSFVISSEGSTLIAHSAITLICGMLSVGLTTTRFVLLKTGVEKVREEDEVD